MGMSSSGTHNEQTKKPTMFDSLWLQLEATIVVTEAAIQALTPSKQLPCLRHSYNMLP
jgi:hypothetical protein